MIVGRHALCLAVVWVAVAAAVSAQQPSQPSLGDLARQTEAAKAAASKAKKTYTNADLPDEAVSEPAPAAEPEATFMSETLGKAVTAEEIIALSEEVVDQASGKAQPEEYWRNRADSLRGQIARLTTRMTALTKPNPTRDANAAAAARNEAEVAKVQQGLNSLMKQWETFEESARVAKVPTEWLDPRPNQ